MARSPVTPVLRRNSYFGYFGKSYFGIPYLRTFQNIMTVKISTGAIYGRYALNLFLHPLDPR